MFWSPSARKMYRRDVLYGMLAVQFRTIAGFLSLYPLAPDAASAQSGTASPITCADTDSEEGRIASKTRRRRMTASLQGGFGVQYWGDMFTVSDLASAPHGLLIIETTRIGATATDTEKTFSVDEIRTISHDGQRPVLGYLNLAKIETYRDYWFDAFQRLGHEPTQRDETWIGPSLGQDGTLAYYWSPDWQKIVEDRVDRLMSLGVSGIFLDDVLQYYTYAYAVTQGNPAFSEVRPLQSDADFARAMMHLVSVAARRARQHDCEALIIVNNGAYIGRDAGPDAEDGASHAEFHNYQSEIDGILIESVFAKGGDASAILVLQEDFLSDGIPVLTIDFINTERFEDEAPSEMKAKTVSLAAKAGFVAYVAEDSLFNRLYPPSPAVSARPASP